MSKDVEIGRKGGKRKEWRGRSQRVYKVHFLKNYIYFLLFGHAV